MKTFFKSFLGAMAAIWLSMMLLSVGTIITISIIAAKTATGGPAVDVKKGSVLVFDLSKQVIDRPATPQLSEILSGDRGQGIVLDDIVAAIDHAATDDKVVGLYIKCKGGYAGLAQYDAIANALEKFKKSGKKIITYGDSYTQGNYYLASIADNILLNPSGSVDLHGLEATTLYFKKMLDKIGVDVQVVKVGTYKSAVEPFLLDSMSAPSRLQQEVFLGNMWSHIAATIAKNRRMKQQQVNQIADSIPAFLPAETLRGMRLVDSLVYERQVDAIVSDLTGSVDKRADDKKTPVYVDLIDYAGSFDASKVNGGGKKNIAVLYAIGDIVDSGDGGIVSEKLVPTIIDLANDDDVDALVMRVNSGGGSAYASEQIWEALKFFKEKTGKPFYVSMGDYAASGGYYISCGADRIYADPLTLTGSIGIFGMLPSVEKLMKDEIGVNTGTVSTNPKGALPTLFQTMTPRQRASMQSYVDNGYELFTRRVAEGRDMPVDSVKAIAEGRVWDGSTALKIKLVDELGDLNTAIAGIAKELGVDSYTISTYPSVDMKWWTALLELDTDMSARHIISHIPGALKLYDSIESIQNMSVLQCRMDYVIVQ